jgi:hypothetical protein
MSDDKLLQEYRDAVSQPPEKGHVLKTLDGSPVVLYVQLEDGKPPFIYGRAYLSEVLDKTLGWYARGTGDDKMVGWKCILMTQARRAVVKQCGDQLAEGKLTVQSLKVVRPSESGRALLCEVHEFVPEPVRAEAPADPVKELPSPEPSLTDLVDTTFDAVTGTGEAASGEEPPVL